MFIQHTNVNTRILFAQPSFLILKLILIFFSLTGRVCDGIMKFQQPNHFLQNSELSLFGTATDVFDDEDEDLIACCYYSVGIKCLIFIDSQLVNLCNDFRFKHFKISFPELSSEKLYHVVKWYDDVVIYCFFF